ncbi:DoxX family protein [Woodsholea maritima]|uniref:DoxX family protein n=1 Tax=Woodsholea maritima TaxID=240237 RepID=UPI0003601CC1|nr:DoxX family protein [Woodsholea maritima]
MSFLILMSVIALISYIPQAIWGDKRDWRMALRQGMGGGFLYTGIDHFLRGAQRYQPMIPDYLAPYDYGLVAMSGGLELAGAIGLLMPLAGWRLAKLPNLRPVAGVGLAMLLSVMVIANAHIAETQAQVAGMNFGDAYFALRPLFQPFIVLWALIASEAVMARKA